MSRVNLFVTFGSPPEDPVNRKGEKQPKVSRVLRAKFVATSTPDCALQTCCPEGSFACAGCAKLSGSSCSQCGGGFLMRSSAWVCGRRNNWVCAVSWGQFHGETEGTPHLFDVSPYSNVPTGPPRPCPFCLVLLGTASPYADAALRLSLGLKLELFQELLLFHQKLAGTSEISTVAQLHAWVLEAKGFWRVMWHDDGRRIQKAYDLLVINTVTQLRWFALDFSHGLKVCSWPWPFRMKRVTRLSCWRNQIDAPWSKFATPASFMRILFESPHVPPKVTIDYSNVSELHLGVSQDRGPSHMENWGCPMLGCLLFPFHLLSKYRVYGSWGRRFNNGNFHTGSLLSCAGG